jgi:hypothetical protein
MQGRPAAVWMRAHLRAWQEATLTIRRSSLQPPEVKVSSPRRQGRRSARNKKPHPGGPALRWAAARAPRFRPARRMERVAVRPQEVRPQPTETVMNVLLPIDATTEPHLSPTDRVIYEMQVYGYRPFQDEPDPRPLPEEPVVQSALTAMFDAMFEMLGDTRLEPDIEELLWSTVNLFHRASERIQRELQRNEDAQRNGQKEQDGSEVKSVELERHILEGITLIERRNAFEFMRDYAADLFEAQTGSAWRPRTGSKVNHATMTAAMIDSRDFLSARRRAETEVLIPAGTKIAFGGGLEYNDHERIWAVLDKTLAKHADMVLLHGGSPKGAERIAACWAEARGVTQVTFKPNWKKHAKAAPFRRNDDMLSVMPAGVIVFPGSGITENLRDKARRFGITVWELRGDGA